MPDSLLLQPMRPSIPSLANDKNATNCIRLTAQASAASGAGANPQNAATVARRSSVAAFCWAASLLSRINDE
jgi:hypothetical protein